MQIDDAVIARIREARHQVSQEQAHDPGKVVAYYIELQKRYEDRLLESPRLDEEDIHSIKA